MRRVAVGLLVIAAGIGVWAGCTEQIIAPGQCPDFCPNGQIELHDTVFSTIISRDSAFRGYSEAYRSAQATAADVPGVQSRPFFKLEPLFLRVKNPGTDTSTVPIVVDSARLRIAITRRDTTPQNLRLQLFALPVTADSTSTFAELDPYFAGPIVDSVNVSDLLTRPLIQDTTFDRALSDSIRTDSAGHVLLISRTDSTYYVYFSLDTLQAPFSEADTGRLAYGVKVVADTAVSIALGTNESVSRGPLMQWFYHFTYTDSTTATNDTTPRSPSIDSFVFDPPSAPIDSNLTVGGVPSARSLLRVNMPPYLHDSIDIVRATLVLMPVGPVAGVAADSFGVFVRPVLADLGAKSPLGDDVAGAAVIQTGSTDTVRIDVTDLVRTWSLIDSLATSFFLQQGPEAISFTQIQFYSSRAAAFSPALHVTYVKRFPFGRP